MQLLGTGVIAAGVEGCERPSEDIVPYVRRPPEVTPGVATFYATTNLRGGYGIGLLAESHSGRPTKLEGHPEHPASLGAASAQDQASVLDLYDPDRAKELREGERIRSWEALAAQLGPASERVFRRRGGEGLHILLEPTSSPFVASLVESVRSALPNAVFHVEPAAAPVQRWEGARRALGQPVETQYDFSRAQVVLALDAPFLDTLMPMSLRWTREFARERSVDRPGGPMNRLYAVESSVSATGATADHRFAVASSEVGKIAAGVLAVVAGLPNGEGVGPAGAGGQSYLEASPHRAWIEAIARDLHGARGRSIVIVGDHQPPEVHAIAHALNELLGNVGRTVSYTPPALLGAGTDAYDIESLLDALDGGAVDVLCVLGANPAYTLPAALGWDERVRNAKDVVHLTMHENETTVGATWVVAQAHYLEAWGDARAYDGTVSLTQPLVRSLYGGRTVEEVLALLAGDPRPSPSQLLRAFWQRRLEGSGVSFGELLRSGLVSGTAFAPVELRADRGAAADAVAAVMRRETPELEVELRPDPRLSEGKQANNPWLQELPEPFTKVAYDNPALISPGTATRLGLENGMVVELESNGSTVLAPVLVAPGQAEGTVTLWLGHGRRRGGAVATGVGVDAAPLRSPERPYSGAARLRKTERREALAISQVEGNMVGRPLVLHRTMKEWEQAPSFAVHQNEDPPTILPDRLESSPQWGMGIDLNRCTGCSACVVACQAENNVPVVGKAQSRLGRAMHWLRIDRYYDGGTNGGGTRVLSQPMLCQHCEKAPCEYVCPVAATTHSPDGLNEMTYNRCVGTRFCSNNCPYKVRRFNWFNFDVGPEVGKMVRNPDVTVRARGVMEKCTFCVQRIRRAQIDARLRNEPLKDGMLQTACQQTCPAQAIVFGDISDPGSEVSRWKNSLRAYGVLTELSNYPRVRYLARIDNANEEISA